MPLANFIPKSIQKTAATIFTLLMLLLTNHHQLNGQQSRAERSWNYAEEFFRREEYIFAIGHYKKVAHRTRYRAVALNKITLCYRALNMNAEALHYANQLLKTVRSETALSLYAEVLKENGMYGKASETFRLLLRKYPSQKKYAVLKNSCDSALSWMHNKTYTVKNFSAVNTEFSEITPGCRAGNIIFSSNREHILIQKKSRYSGEPFFDLYQYNPEEKKASPSPVSPVINSIHHEFAPCFSPGGDSLFFARSIDRNRIKTDSINRLKLFCSVKDQEGNWNNPLEYHMNDSTSSFAHPFISQDGTLFFFASDMKGGYGGSDIYVCLKLDSLWSRPINLGPQVNSPYSETYPVYFNGNIWFSSDRPEGMGGYDLYKAHQNKGEWNRIENMKYPVNSPSDDFAITFDQENDQAYFCSDRPEGKGKEDIYIISGF